MLMRPTSTRLLSLLAWTLFLAGLIVYLVSFRMQVERNPLRVDEVDFYRCMRNVIDLGRPLYYAGEVNLPAAHVQPLGAATLGGKPFQFYRFKPETGILKETFFGITDGDSRYTYCLWHPPLYVYLGSLVLRLVHLPDAQAHLFRYAHLALVALMLGGLAALLRELYRPAWFLGLALTTLFLGCSSLAARAAVLIDYNGALAMAVAVWVAWAFLVADRAPRAAPLAAGLLALSFLTGLGVGAALSIGLLGWSLVLRRSSFPRHALTVVAGIAAFLIAFFVFARAGHFPFSQPFLHNFQRAALSAPLAQRFAATLHYAGWYLREIGVAAAAAAALLAALRLVRRHPGARSAGEAGAPARALLPPTLALAALLTQAALSADAWGFPKYIAFALPLLFAFIGGELAALSQHRRSRWAAAALAAVLVAALTWQSVEVLRRPGGTLYLAGEQGFLDAAAALRANLGPDEVFLGSKDASFYAGRKFAQWSGSLWTDRGLLEQRVTDEGARLAAASAGQLAAASPDVVAWLAERGILIANPGDQRVYRIR